MARLFSSVQLVTNPTEVLKYIPPPFNLVRFSKNLESLTVAEAALKPPPLAPAELPSKTQFVISND
ncbi:MAG TPA: hypothetical protein VIV82_05325, partial [Verrucomicrobiae bacterium]